MATRKPPAENPDPDGGLRAELRSLARTLDAWVTMPALKGQELRRLVARVRAAVHDQPFAKKERESHARSLLLGYCSAHRGEGKLAARDLDTAAEVVIRGLGDAMPEFLERAQRAKPQIKAMIAAQAAPVSGPRGRPTKLERLTALVSKPDLDTATRKVCKAMGWSEALPKSVDRQTRRKKK